MCNLWTLPHLTQAHKLLMCSCSHVALSPGPSHLGMGLGMRLVHILVVGVFCARYYQIMLLITACEPRSREMKVLLWYNNAVSEIYTAICRIIIDIHTHLDAFVSINNTVKTAARFTGQ